MKYYNILKLAASSKNFTKSLDFFVLGEKGSVK